MYEQIRKNTENTKVDRILNRLMHSFSVISAAIAQIMYC